MPGSATSGSAACSSRTHRDRGCGLRRGRWLLPDRSHRGGTREIWLQNAGFIWVPFIVVIAIAAWFGMHNLSGARASFSDQSIIFKRKHNWLDVLAVHRHIRLIHRLLRRLSACDPDTVRRRWIRFSSPSSGPRRRCHRPVGGWISDKFGGARVTFWNFIVMALAAGGVIYFIRLADQPGAFIGFFAMFLILFTTTGIGNGSTFRMIPVIFLNQHTKGLIDPEEVAIARGTRNGSRAPCSASPRRSVPTEGFFIPLAYGYSIAETGSAEVALWGFIAFYATCVVITWWYYFRRNADAPC
jgi:MFS transporter, NNP family, nitrate/nitrite transporter